MRKSRSERGGFFNYAPLVRHNFCQNPRFFSVSNALLRE